MRSKRRLKVVGLGAAALLLTAACGNGDDEVTQPVDGDGNGDQVLTFGYVLPETGDLAFLGPPQISAIDFAISKINEAGGVLGNEVPAPVSGDEAGDAAVASSSADRVLNAGVSAVIGAAASGMSLAIIDKITGAEVAQCSGSNTAPTFTDYEDGGFYFRTAPSDALQGPVLAEVITSEGYSNVAIVARADDYGRGLANATAEALENAGATVALNETYDPAAANFDALIQSARAAQPDAVTVIAFEEGAQIIGGLLEAGITPDRIGIFGADGLRNTELATLVSPGNPGRLAGMMGTAPAAEENPEFVAELQEFAPELEQLQFAPQVFDCVVLVALAAEQAGSVAAADFAPLIVDITKEGEKCTSFADCKALLDEDEDIDYDGASGPLEFVDAGEPGTATIEVWAFDEEGNFQSLRSVESAPAE